MILVLDNYDSFTYNLVHILYTLDCEILVKRNRELELTDIEKLNPEAILLSPGPGRPEKAGIMPDLIERFKERIPMLGVCLGHQAIGAAFGAEVFLAQKVMHGKTSIITHDGKGLFQNIRNPFKAVRYHSLALKESTLPDCLEVTARAEDGEIMGIRHKKYLLEGIQYHPESIMTANGKKQLENFLNLVKEGKRND